MDRVRVVIYANFIIVIGLVILYGLTWLNTLFDRKQRKLFMGAIIAVLFVVVCISADYICAGYNNPIAVTIRRFTSFVNFGASPLIPILLAALFNRRKRKLIYYTPAAISAVCSFISMYVPLVFYIHDENSYWRGPLFILPFAVTVVYMLLLIFLPSARQRKARSRERQFLVLVVLLIGLAMCMELYLKMSFLMWDVAAISLMLYYLFLNITFFTMDGLTGCYNRLAYTRVLLEYTDKKPCHLTIMDLNGLKKVNDTKGHQEGDRLLASFADILTKHTGNVSDLYRIGGDEFVLLTKPKNIEAYKAGMESARNEAVAKGVSFADGEAIYEPSDNMEEVMALADERMYKRKKEMKETEITANAEMN